MPKVVGENLTPGRLAPSHPRAICSYAQEVFRSSAVKYDRESFTQESAFSDQFFFQVLFQRFRYNPRHSGRDGASLAPEQTNIRRGRKTRGEKNPFSVPSLLLRGGLLLGGNVDGASPWGSEQQAARGVAPVSESISGSKARSRGIRGAGIARRDSRGAVHEPIERQRF